MDVRKGKIWAVRGMLKCFPAKFLKLSPHLIGCMGTGVIMQKDDSVRQHSKAFWLYSLAFLFLSSGSSVFAYNIDHYIRGYDDLIIYTMQILNPTRNVVCPSGASGSMSACHAAGPGSIPGQDRFPG